jgi:hypothetical protein
MSLVEMVVRAPPFCDESNNLTSAREQLISAATDNTCPGARLMVRLRCAAASLRLDLSPAPPSAASPLEKYVRVLLLSHADTHL